VGLGVGDTVGTLEVAGAVGIAVGRVVGVMVCTVTAPKGARTATWPEHGMLPSQPSTMRTNWQVGRFDVYDSSPQPPQVLSTGRGLMANSSFLSLNTFRYVWPVQYAFELDCGQVVILAEVPGQMYMPQPGNGIEFPGLR
jgi:hypothetical protein